MFRRIPIRLTDLRICISLFLIGVLTRIFFLEKYQSHWDGPNYSLALVNYSFIEKTPTEPGYPLYIAIGRLFHFFISDVHISILAVSALFAGIGAITSYFVGKTIFNKSVGLISSALFLSAPTLYYFGITANPYGLLFTTTSLLAVSVYLIIVKHKKSGIFLALAFAFSIGVRPQDLMFLFPLFLFGLLHLPKKEIPKTIVATFITFLVWFIPTSMAVGGIVIYMGYVFDFFNGGSAARISPARIIEITPILIKGFFLTFSISFLFLAYYLRPLSKFIRTRAIKPSSIQKNILFLFLFWILPSLLFNIFIRSDHAAHQMAYLSGFLYLISYGLWKTFRSKRLLFLAVCLLVLFNLYTFFRVRDVKMSKPYVSQSYHYSELVKNNIRIPAIVNYISKYPGENTLIIVDPEIFRPYSYYLQGYRMYAYSVLDTKDPANVNSVHFSYNRHYEKQSNKSHILKVPSGIERIIIIPNNKEYDLKVHDAEKVLLKGNAYIYVFPSKIKAYELSLHKIAVKQ